MIKDKIFDIKNSSEFENIALNIFNYQIKNNPVYAKYASLLLQGKYPENIASIPFLPISFFKEQEVICNGETSEKIFLSSGSVGKQSRHLVSNICLYQKSYLKSFELFYGNITTYCILSLLPNYRERENSSLIFMIDDLISKSQHSKSGFFLNDYKKLSSILNHLEKIGQKTILFGVSYALLDLAEQFPQKLKNTIIIETGGTKGKRQEILKEELHFRLKTSFQLEKIHSEYGMTEILSQSYSKGDGIFKLPPWKKVLIRDTHDPLTIIGDNKKGGINIIDLANIYSCPFIATDDLGIKYKDESFSVVGRFDNSDVRGCNQLIE